MHSFTTSIIEGCNLSVWESSSGEIFLAPTTASQGARVVGVHATDTFSDLLLHIDDCAAFWGLFPGIVVAVLFA